MKSIFLLSFLMLSFACISEAVETNKPSSITSNGKTRRSTSTVGRRQYKFPSMMIKNDMFHCEKKDDYNCTSLLENLVVNRWSIIRDKYGRLCKYSSPVITYAELKEYLHFKDADVLYVKDPKQGEPQAVIRTEWLTCNITFLNRVYDGKDTSAKLAAMLIDNEVMANSVKEEEYHKKTE